MKLTEEQFCKMYNAYYSDEISNSMQLTETFDGVMLKEFIEHCIEFNNVVGLDHVSGTSEKLCSCWEKEYSSNAYCSKCKGKKVF